MSNVVWEWHAKDHPKYIVECSETGEEWRTWGAPFRIKEDALESALEKRRYYNHVRVVAVRQ